MPGPVDAIYSIQENLPKTHHGLFCAAAAELLLPLYGKYDREGDRLQLLRSYLDLVWAALTEAPRKRKRILTPKALADKTVPDVDFDKSDHANLAQSSSISVVNAWEFVNSGDPECALCAAEQIEFAIEFLSDSKEDEAAYSRALIAMRGLPVDELRKQIDALNKKRPSSSASRRVAKTVREFCAAMKESARSPLAPDQLTVFASQIHSHAAKLMAVST